MAALTGSTVASTYTQLLKLTSASLGADASAKYIEDGAGTDSALSISTTRIGIGTAAPDTLLHLYSTSASKPILKIENEQGGANPVSIQLLRNTSSPADDDFIGQIDFRSMNDAGTPEETLYAYISAQSTDITDGEEDGEINFHTMKAGTATNTMTMQSGNVGIGESDPLGKLHIKTGDTSYSPSALADELVIEGTGSTGMTILTANDQVGRIYFGDNTATRGGIVYDHNTTNMKIMSESVTNMVLDANSRISLSNNDSGTSNTVFGYGAGMPTGTNSNFNVIIGHETFDLVANDGAVGNVFVGYRAARGNPTADTDHNIGIGYVALGALTSGDSNICIGSSAGVAITEEHNVIAIGRNAGAAIDNTGADGTVAIGRDALTALTSGAGNVAIGHTALVTNADGSYNTAVGYESLYTFEADTINHGNNTTVGYRSGKFISVGTENTFIGMNSGKGSSGTPLQGDNNVAVGQAAGLLLEGAAHSNTFIGTAAGNTTESGVENTCIGFNTEAQDNTATNQIVIGNNVTGTADNAVHIGNDTSHIRCDFNSDQTWDASSDRRQKKDIEESELGLDFINDLKPSKYRHKSPSEFPEEWSAYNADDKEPMGGSDKYYYGFIAQEVKESIDKYDASDYGAWNVDEDGRQRISREQFVVSLVKAVQELTAKVEALENK